MLFICSALKHTSAFYLFILDVLFSSCMCNIIALKQRWKTESVGAELKAYVQGLLFRILTFCSNSELLIIKMSFEFLQFNIGNAHLARYFQNDAVLAYCFGLVFSSQNMVSILKSETKYFKRCLSKIRSHLYGERFCYFLL